MEVADPSQFPIIAEKRGGSLFQAGGDLQRVGGAEAVLGAQLGRATRCRPVKRGNDHVGIVARGPRIPRRRLVASVAAA